MTDARGTLLWQYPEHWAAKKPDAEALVFEGERVTWREFRELTDNIAKAFIEIGVAAGERVAMLSMARTEFLPTFMAASKIGAAWVGLSPKFSYDELLYILRDCAPTVLVTLREYGDRDLTGDIQNFMREVPSLKRVLVIGEPVEGAESFHEYVDRPRPEAKQTLNTRAEQGNPKDDVLLMYTSGSTGKPKGVLHSHESIIRNIEVEAARFGVDGDSRVLLHFPINHVAADVEIGFAALYAGACTVMMDRFDPVASLKTVESEGVTLFGQVPAMFLMQFARPEAKEIDWRSVRTFVWAGAAAPRPLVEGLAAIAEKTGARLITGYGSTELAGFVTYSDPNDDIDTLTSSVGRIAEPFELRVVDDERRELPAGAVGELAVRRPIVTKGYLNRPEDTAAVLDEDGWYYTDDLGYLDERGYIYLTGRKSEMFKSGGENVHPREIEEALEQHPGVLFAAVLGVPDDVYQEVGHAFVMPKPGAGIDADSLRAHCREHLANFKVPKTIDIHAQLPLLPTGKVNKVALRELLEQGAKQ